MGEIKLTMSMSHQVHPSILSERTGMVSSELGIVLRAHPIPSGRLMNAYADFPHPDPQYMHFRTGDSYHSRGVASSPGFEPMLKVFHPASEIAFVRRSTGPQGPAGDGPLLSHYTQQPY